MKIIKTEEGILLNHTIKGLNEEGIEVNMENYEWRGFADIESAEAFAKNWLSERGIDEEILLQE